jgi:alkylhydroperoxidase/carboxymuconolactone decarboxylase family protein YurZ
VVPRIPSTLDLLNRDAMAALKPGAVLVDVSRGGVVNETALIEALKDGRLRGAVLDVFSTEPLPRNNPLWRMENVVITPHIAGFFDGWEAAAADIFCENLDRWRAGMANRQLSLGRSIRRDVLGEERYRQLVDGATPFERPFQDFVSEYCWGANWGRGVLPREQRSMLTLSMLAALGRSAEFEAHFRAAVVNLKIPLDQLREALFHISVYCGIPAGVESFRIARRVLAEAGMPPLDGPPTAVAKGPRAAGRKRAAGRDGAASRRRRR